MACASCGGRGWFTVGVNEWPIECSECKPIDARELARLLEVDARTIRRLDAWKRGAQSVKYSTAARMFPKLVELMPPSRDQADEEERTHARTHAQEACRDACSSRVKPGFPSPPEL